MEGIGALLGVSVVAWIGLGIAAAIALPFAYLWMLIDAIVRDVDQFPSRDVAEKILWIIVMLTIHPVAAVYFFMVWLPNNRSRFGARATATPSAAA